jgi:hypothetical protein
MTITDLLEQSVPLKDVQRLAGWPAKPIRAPPGSTTAATRRSPATSWRESRFEKGL